MSLCQNVALPVVGKTWCLYLPATSSIYIPLLGALHNLATQFYNAESLKKASEGVCSVLLCCYSHSLLLREQLLVELHFELCFGSSTDVVFSFELDQFPLLPDLFVSTAVQKAVLTPQLVLLLVLRCCEHSCLDGRSRRLSESWLV